MFESIGEAVEVGAGHAERTSLILPPRDSLLHLCQHLLRACRGDAEVRQDRHQGIDGRLGADLFRDPGLQLAQPLGERIDVEGRRQQPQATIDVEEAVIDQVIVDVGDEDRKGDPAP